MNDDNPYYSRLRMLGELMERHPGNTRLLKHLVDTDIAWHASPIEPFEQWPDEEKQKARAYLQRYGRRFSGSAAANGFRLPR